MKTGSLEHASRAGFRESAETEKRPQESDTRKQRSSEPPQREARERGRLFQAPAEAALRHAESWPQPPRSGGELGRHFVLKYNRLTLATD